MHHMQNTKNTTDLLRTEQVLMRSGLHQNLACMQYFDVELRQAGITAEFHKWLHSKLSALYAVWSQLIWILFSSKWMSATTSMVTILELLVILFCNCSHILESHSTNQKIKLNFVTKSSLHSYHSTKTPFLRTSLVEKHRNPPYYRRQVLLLSPFHPYAHSYNQDWRLTENHTEVNHTSFILCTLAPEWSQE